VASVLQKLLVKKETLDNTDDSQHLTFVCKQLYGGKWDDHYAACDLHLVAFGAKAGANEVPNEDLEPKKYATYLENVVTTLSTLGLVTALKTSLKRKRNYIIRALHIMRKYVNFHDAFTFGECIQCSYSKVEHQIPCVLHLHKRVIEKVLTLLFTRSLDELANEGNTKRIKHILEHFNLMRTHSLWVPREKLVTENVQSRMATRSVIAALRTCKQKILKNSWGALLKRLWLWKNHTRTTGSRL
jgi:hypothetical protein